MVTVVALQVTCVVKDNSFDPCHRIQGLGGDGWYHTVDQVISNIESGRAQYFTEVQGRRAEVVVAVNPRTGRKFVRTTADSFEPNNLLALPACR